LTSIGIYLMIFTHAAPHTKSKGLPIDIPNWLSSNTFYTHRVNRSRMTYRRTFLKQQPSTYLQTRYPCAQDLKDQPHDSRFVPDARRLWLCHVPRGIEHATRQKRALVSPRAPCHKACHSLGVGFGVATCPEAPSPSPDRRRLQSRHVPRGSWPAPCVGRLWRRHVTEAPGPLLGRAPVPPRVLWL
jgi:hypothetical protein